MKTQNHRRTYSHLASIVLVVACGMTISAAHAQPAATTDQAASNEDFSFARRLSRVFRSVAKQTEPAVVHITSSRTLMQRDWFGQPLGRRTVPGGVGSGAFVRADGIILTNNHVIANAESIKVKLTDNRELDATLIGRDELTDLAVLRVVSPEGTSFPTLSFADSETVEVGEWVVAIGSPFGLDNTLTQGIISAKGRTVTPRETGISYQDYIQTDAAINPGNSGGPLINLEGKVVGINSAIASRTGGYDGIGFAIPSNLAKAVLDNILANGKVVRGWLGVQFGGDTPPGTAGVNVAQVVDQSPASDAGLKAGDIITRLNGSPAANIERVMREIAVMGPGAKANLEFVREGKPMNATATLGDFYAQQPVVRVAELGVSVVALDERRVRDLNISGGVEIREIEPGAAARGLEVGDVIVGVGDNRTPTPEALQKAMSRVRAGRPFDLMVVRGDERGYLRVNE